MASKYVQLSLLWTVVHISKLIRQRYKSLAKSEKWLIKYFSVPFNVLLTVDKSTVYN